jgi:hypothetical protein
VIEPLGGEIARELARFGVASGLAALVEAWPAAVGPAVARNAWPARIVHDGTLHVHTSSATWAFELLQLEQRIRAALGELAPPRLRFAVGPLPEPPFEPAAEAARERADPADEHRAQGRELAAAIEDENLRETVAKAVAASLASGDSRRSVW